MAGWVLGRLVSGLGTATRDAPLLPLARQACADHAGCSSLVAASLGWRPWPAQVGGLLRSQHGASLATSAAADAAAASASSQVAAGAADAAASPTAAAPDAAEAAAAGAASSANASEAGPSAAPPAAAAAAGGDSSGGSDTSTSSSNSSSSSGGGVRSATEPQPEAPEPDPKPELVELLLSAEAGGNRALQRKAARAEVVRQFQRHPADTGSPQVMVAMWTHRVRELVRHFDANRKQLPAMRELEMLVNRRQRMLTWLRRTDFESYSYTISKLGLTDIYTPVGQSDRYREGLRAGDPVADDSVNRKRFNYHTKYRQPKSSLWAKLRPRLVAEDPALGAEDRARAAADKRSQQEQRMSAAKAHVYV